MNNIMNCMLAVLFSAFFIISGILLICLGIWVVSIVNT
jgi:hypothetical protein